MTALPGRNREGGYCLLNNFQVIVGGVGEVGSGYGDISIFSGDESCLTGNRCGMEDEINTIYSLCFFLILQYSLQPKLIGLKAL